MSRHIITVLETVRHSEHRYETVGDYYDDKTTGLKHIVSSQMKDWRYVFLIHYHEQIEEALTRQRGITELEITLFDKQFEEEREMGLHGDYDEPGDSVLAPYHKEHQLATTLEKLMAIELGVDWTDYENTINSLSDSNVGC